MIDKYDLLIGKADRVSGFVWLFLRYCLYQHRRSLGRLIAQDRDLFFPMEGYSFR
jgi:hypothetical protein